MKILLDYSRTTTTEKIFEKNFSFMLKSALQEKCNFYFVISNFYFLFAKVDKILFLVGRLGTRVVIP